MKEPRMTGDNPHASSAAPPRLVAIDMGYGHLRPAAALAERLAVPVQQMDKPPLGTEQDAAFWRRTRSFYEPLTRWSQVPVLGGPAQALLDAITHIPPLYPERDLSAPNPGTKALVRGAKAGLGRGLADELKRSGAPLLTTFYAPAVLSELHGCERVACVVTDSDVNRVWAPADPPHSAIVYFAPATHTARRLRAYGVRAEKVRVTGFPLPHELLGGPELPLLRQNLAARLVRLDPRGTFLTSHAAELERALGPLPQAERGRAPLLTFAVGGAGAQVGLVRSFLPSLARLISEGRLRLALVAGRRAEVATRLRGFLDAAGLREGEAVRVLEAPDVDGYFPLFNRLLAETDILWTKPSEMTFFAALGLPLVVAPAVGVHELCNQRWAQEWGAALAQGEPAHAAEWLDDWIEDGVLAAAAWAGYRHLPNRGLYRILEELQQL
jgi:hypothetical protein